MKRARYLVEVRFHYSNGTGNGILSRIVSSRKMGRDQLSLDKEWCERHNHTILDEKIEEVANER